MTPEEVLGEIEGDIVNHLTHLIHSQLAIVPMLREKGDFLSLLSTLIIQIILSTLISLIILTHIIQTSRVCSYSIRIAFRVL